MTQSAHKPRHKLLLMAAGASALILTGAVIALFVFMSGAINIEATRQHFRITHHLLDIGLRFSVRSRASDIVAPPLDDPRMIAVGAACYQTYCEQCHGAPGVGAQAHALGMLPTPNSLTQAAHEWPAAHLYYVTREGVRITGMPAWKFRIADDGLWSTVAFVRRLPTLTDERYAQLASSAPACPESTTLPEPRSLEQGRTVLLQYACHTCHRIEGVVGPPARVGPPLVDWPQRKYIAGVAPNTPDNLVRWIMAPHDMSPQTLMPDLDVAEAHAREMAAYLFSL